MAAPSRGSQVGLPGTPGYSEDDVGDGAPSLPTASLNATRNPEAGARQRHHPAAEPKADSRELETADPQGRQAPIKGGGSRTRLAPAFVANSTSGVPLTGSLASVDGLLQFILPHRAAVGCTWDWQPQRVVAGITCLCCVAATAYVDAATMVRDNVPVDEPRQVNEVVQLVAGSASMLMGAALSGAVCAGLVPTALADTLGALSLPADRPEHAALQTSATRWYRGYVSVVGLVVLGFVGELVVAALDLRGVDDKPVRDWTRNTMPGIIVVAITTSMSTVYIGAVFVHVGIAARALVLQTHAVGDELGLPALDVRREAWATGGGPPEADKVAVASARPTEKVEPIDEAVAVAPISPREADGAGVPALRARDLFVLRVRRPIALVDAELHGVFAPLLLFYIGMAVASMLPMLRTAAQGDAAPWRDRLFVEQFAAWMAPLISVGVGMACVAATVHSAVVRLAARVSLGVQFEPDDPCAQPLRQAAGSRESSLLPVALDAGLEHAITLALPFCGLRAVGRQCFTFSLLGNAGSLAASVVLLYTANQ